MELDINDWIGFSGVFLLLLAYGMNLIGWMSRNSLVYIVLNIAGAGLAGYASWRISYMPFVLLEGIWTMVSIGALVQYLRKKPGKV